MFYALCFYTGESLCKLVPLLRHATIHFLDMCSTTSDALINRLRTGLHSLYLQPSSSVGLYGKDGQLVVCQQKELRIQKQKKQRI